MLESEMSHHYGNVFDELSTTKYSCDNTKSHVSDHRETFSMRIEYERFFKEWSILAVVRLLPIYSLGRYHCETGCNFFLLSVAEYVPSG